jgi:putative peptide zinc metalloprotease protein
VQAIPRVRIVWPATMRLPTARRPVLAMVLVPHGTAARLDSATVRVPEPRAPATSTAPLDAPSPVEATGTDAGPQASAPSWVFPFDRPAAPGAGDNQALAVNTEDGSVKYDVAFALVWADDGPVLNTNEAYAFASCRACTTVAVSFQVVLIAGQVDVVVPQNIAAAVNYNCVECLTAALATQLVVTLDGPLSAAGMDELQDLWAEIAAFGRNLEGLSLAQIRDRLTAYESRILDIIETDPGSTPATTVPAESTTDPDADGGDDGAGSVTTVGPSQPSATDGADDDVPPAGEEATGGSDSSADDTAEPSSAPTAESSTAPEPEPTASSSPSPTEASPTPTAQESTTSASPTATPTG